MVGLRFALALLSVPFATQSASAASPTAAVPPSAGWEANRTPAKIRWTAERANSWYARQHWIVGANFLPSTAINQLEMFQDETWDAETIDRELALAASIGMNAMRVYLHDLLWQKDKAQVIRRLDEFMTIAQRHGIKTIPVFFDSVHDPDPQLGQQRYPDHGLHNPGWVQSPSRRTLIDRKRHPQLLVFVEGVVKAFARDDRVLMWDIWNEPDGDGGNGWRMLELPGERAAMLELLPKVFAAARAAGPVQPLTSGLWYGNDWSPTSKSLSEVQKVQLENSDIVSFHDYNWAETFEQRVAQLKLYGRPVICTEWLARSNGSLVETVLPIAHREGVGMINWGLVDGKSQTRLPWESWFRPYVNREPAIWFHDLFRADGIPFRKSEADLFRQLTGRGNPPDTKPATRPANPD
jgi:hypothetical protein